MEPLIILVEQSREGGLEAYGELVRRFQDMAAGYAYAILGDYHLAEDASQEAFVRDRVLGTMSQRVRTYIEEEMEALGPVPAEVVRRAQQGMVDLLHQFRYPGRKLSKEHQDRKRRLKRLLRAKPFAQMTLGEITGLFVDLSRISSEEGPLAVESFAGAIPEGRAKTDPDVLLFISGLRRGVGGHGAELINRLLDKRMRQLLQEHETRCKIISEGVAALAERANPNYMEARLRAHYAVDSY